VQFAANIISDTARATDRRRVVLSTCIPPQLRYRLTSLGNVIDRQTDGHVAIQRPAQLVETVTMCITDDLESPST